MNKYLMWCAVGLTMIGSTSLAQAITFMDNFDTPSFTQQNWQAVIGQKSDWHTIDKSIVTKNPADAGNLWYEHNTQLETFIALNDHFYTSGLKINAIFGYSPTGYQNLDHTLAIPFGMQPSTNPNSDGEFSGYYTSIEYNGFWNGVHNFEFTAGTSGNASPAIEIPFTVVNGVTSWREIEITTSATGFFSTLYFYNNGRGDKIAEISYNFSSPINPSGLVGVYGSGNWDIIRMGRFEVLGDVAPVPEPTTMLLFGTGLAGLAAVGRKRRV